MSARREKGRMELVLLAAEDDAALVARVRALAAFLELAPGAVLKDVAYTCACAYSELRKRRPNGRISVLSLVVETVEDLRAHLAAAAVRVADGVERIKDRSGTYFFREHVLGPDAERPGKLAFLFPGAFSFYPNMLRDLALAFPLVRASFDELEEALAGAAGPFSPASFVFPPAPCYRRDADVFSSGAYAEALLAVFSANCAMARLLHALALVPDGVAGFSGGGMNTAVAAGILGKLTRARRLEFMRDLYAVVDRAARHSGLPSCKLLVVFLAADKMEDALRALPPGKVHVAFVLTPSIRTLAIDPAAVNDATAALSAAGARFLELEVDKPFNTPLCAPALPAFRKFSARWIREKPSVRAYTCGRSVVLPEKPRKAREAAASLWGEHADFLGLVRRLHADGFRVFLEVGPGNKATAAVEEILRGQPHVALALNVFSRSDVNQLLHALGVLAAVGAPLDPSLLFAHRRCRPVDFSAPLFLDVRTYASLALSRALPRFALSGSLFPAAERSGVMAPEEVPGERRKSRGKRLSSDDARARHRRQFETGFSLPLISDADELDFRPAISADLVKTLSLANEPFFADFALGAARISYGDAGLKGLVMLHLAAGAELLAETAQKILPNFRVCALENLVSRRDVAFEGGKLEVRLHAERVAVADPSLTAVKAEMRVGEAHTTPVMEATVVLRPATASGEDLPPLLISPLSRPRSVHWEARDVYPERLTAGESLRLIRKVDEWCENGMDYELEVPARGGTLASIPYPIWSVHPQVLAAIMDGFPLWRGNGRFAGALALPRSVGRLVLRVPSFQEGARFVCHLRLTDATNETQIADVRVTDGDGRVVAELLDYAEVVDRVQTGYRRKLLSPAQAFLTDRLPPEVLGSPGVPFAAAMVENIPYDVFERREGIWFKALSLATLNRAERRESQGFSGSSARRTEWLFGRIAIKEAVRQLLMDTCQAMWMDADVRVFRPGNGKPQVSGKWMDYTSAKIDVALTHTARCIVAVAVTNARAGVDVEAVDRDVSEEFARAAFSGDELALAAANASATAVLLRFWCAKEAASKALGSGIRYSPRDITVASFVPETGDMQIALAGDWLVDFKQFKGRTIPVSSTILHGHVLTSCFIPNSQFRTFGEGGGE